MGRSRLAVALLANLAIALGSDSSVLHGEPTWEVHQLTFGPTNDVFPTVCGTTYVWHANTGPTGGVIMKWTEGDVEPINIADNLTAASARCTDQGVVWTSKSSTFTDYEIRLYRDGVVSPLTDNTIDEFDPDAGGIGRLWRVGGILHHDTDGQHTEIPSEGSLGGHARVMDRWVVWEAGNSDRNVYLWNDGVTNPLTGTEGNDHEPDTDGHSVVWYSNYGFAQSKQAVFQWTPQSGAQRITEEELFGWRPAVSGDVVVFAGWDGHDYEIFIRYFGVSYQITHNDFLDEEPEIDGNRIVWQGGGSGSFRIYYAILDGLDGGGDPPGACCVGSECTSRTGMECDSLGGAFSGPNTFCVPDHCPAGSEPATGWWTYQHDSQRTGRTTSVVSSVRNRIWSVLVARPPSGSQSPIPLQATIAPDGTLHTGVASISPSGQVNWAVLEQPNITSPSIRADGDVWAGLWRFDGDTGEPYCGTDTNTIPGLMDSEGNAYTVVGGPGTVRVNKSTRSCSRPWTFEKTTGQGEFASLARGTDGGIQVSASYWHIKVDPTTGQELWSEEFDAETGAPAVDDDGSIVFGVVPNRLVKMSSAGSVLWDLPLVDIHYSDPAPSPAIGEDGTLYFSTGSRGAAGSGAALVAVSPDGVERWRFVAGTGSGLAFSPVVEGSGLVLFSAGRRLHARRPADGSQAWRIDLGPDESVYSTPSIAEDGTIYLVTSRGYLAAFGNGCPELPVVAPFDFRAVAREREATDGVMVDFLDEFEVQHDGLMTFVVTSGGKQVAFIENPDTTFRIIRQGTVIDGYAIDQVGLPRRDRLGNLFVPAYVVDVGPGLFVNEKLFVRQGGLPEVPIRMYSYTNWRYFDHNELGSFTILGRLVEVDQPSLYSVEIETATATRLIRENQVIDGHIVQNMDPPRLGGYRDDGIPILRSGNTAPAIITPTAVVAKSGDFFDGWLMLSPRSPVRAEDGTVFFLDEQNVFKAPPGGAPMLHRGTGDTVSGQFISRIWNISVNAAGDLAYRAELLASGGVYLDDVPVYIRGVTTVDDPAAMADASVEGPVSVNNRRDVAFVAGSTLYVASLLAFDLDGDGDVDGSDVSQTEGCFVSGVPNTCQCLSRADVNWSKSVDCADWNILKRAWTGPPLFPPFVASCDEDCDGNLIADDLEIAQQTVRDCNNNKRIDDCEQHGDVNGDRVVTLTDFEALRSDLGGPQSVRPCSFFDVDRDDDVDLTDVSRFILEFESGP